MTLTWNLNNTPDSCIYSAEIMTTDESSLRAALETSTEKAISLLTDNIRDDSLYFLCEWNTANSTLTINVTDASKTIDGQHIVICRFTGLNTVLHHLNQSEYTRQIVEKTELVKFWLHDYLTTCVAFFNYSLVAIFHSDSRSNTELL